MITTELIEIALEFGLPTVEREDSIVVVGEENFIVFIKTEETQCQLIEIY